MTYLIEVIVERNIFSHDKSFLYYFKSEKEPLIGVRVLIDFNGSKIIGYVINVSEADFDVHKKFNSFTLKPILEVLDEQPILNEELFKVAKYMSYRYVSPLISCLQTMLPTGLKPSTTKTVVKNKTIKIVRLVDNNYSPIKVNEISLINALKKNGFLKKSAISAHYCKKLLDLGVIKEEEIIDESPSFSDFSIKDFKLTKAQTDAYNQINNSKKDVVLFKGITGSGKTEIYIKLIESELKNGRSAVFLVPEINLTPYFCSLLTSYFGNDVAILTSGLTNNERITEYQLIANGKKKIVVGTRSAVFAPLTNIGIFIIDEEFSHNYKEAETMPFYNALVIAKYRAKLNNSKVILGSATPSIESMSRAQNGIYDYVELNERYNKKTLPKIELIDMTNIDNVLPGSSFISFRLYCEILNRLEKKEQVILYINKKGFSNINVCSNCEKTLHCPKCDHALTYYKNSNFLKCNFCGYSINSNNYKCPTCGENHFKNIGVGIEKLEAEIKKLFSSARILRMDGDLITSSKKANEVIKKFIDGEADILIGTSMIMKGHNFNNASLIGIISIDQMLFLPFYNVNEQIFQTITQAAGRVGRGDNDGLCIVQTNSSSSYPIAIGTTQDYDLFYKKEMLNRKNLANPPYFNIAKITIESNSSLEISDGYEFVKTLNLFFANFDNIEIIFHRYIFKKGIKKQLNIILKFKNYKIVLDGLNEIMKNIKSSWNLKYIIDIDPISY